MFSENIGDPEKRICDQKFVACPIAATALRLAHAESGLLRWSEVCL